MWKQIYPDLPPEVARVTTSVWDYEDYGCVGVMRTSFLSPPVLWFQLSKFTPSMLKIAPKLLTDLQLQLAADLVYAEAKLDEIKSQRFLRFMGFLERPESYERKLFSRSI